MIDENKLIIAIANWQMTLNPGWSSANDTDTVTYNTLEEVVGLIDDQPTIQPQGIDKDRLIEELEERWSRMIPGSDGRHLVSIEKVIDFISKFPPTATLDVPDTNDGEIPQPYKERE